MLVLTLFFVNLFILFVFYENILLNYIKQRIPCNWILLLAISNPRIKIDGCWLKYGIGIEHLGTILWDPFPLVYRNLSKLPRAGGSNFLLKKKENSTMYLFPRKALISLNLKPKCGYLFILTVIINLFPKYKKMIY